MCLVNFHYKQHPVYSLIVAANRDEFYERPTAPANYWEDHPDILAGRDLLQMGTWLGISKNGRFAALTNFRDSSLLDGTQSRGTIVKDFLNTQKSPSEFIDKLSKERESYGGFNIILADGKQFLHYNNVLNERNDIIPGTHSLSNHTLNTPWPKVEYGKRSLSQYVEEHPDQVNPEALFHLLANEEVAPDHSLPVTGIGLDMERSLSPLFIKLPQYGTRSSTVLLIDQEKNVDFIERTFHNGAFYSERKYHFKIK